MKKICLLLLAMSFCHTALRAQSVALRSSAQELTLEQCLDMAEKKNLSLRAARGEAERSEILEGTAWDIDKTELSLSQDPTSGASPDNALTLSQSIDFPTRYMARKRQLKAETRSRQSEVAVTRSRLRGRVASLFYELVYQREKLRILRGQDSILARYEDIAAKRYDAGEARQLEPLNARRLRQENRLETVRAEADSVTAHVALATLLGADAAVQPSQSGLSPIAFQADGYSYRQSPEGQLAELRLSVADEAVKVAKSEYAPSLSVALRTQMVIKGWNPYHVDRSWNDGNFMGFEVGVGLPIFNGATRARVRSARKEREQMELQAESEALQREGEYAAATSRMDAAKSQMDYYMAAGSNDAATAAAVSANAYEAGEISYIEYVEALRQNIDTRLKCAEAINSYNQAVVTLMTLRGAI